MNTRKWIAALTLLALPALAQAQSMAQDGQRFNPAGSGTSANNSTVLVPALVGGVVRADTTAKALTMDSDGNLYVTEAVPVTTFLKKYQSIIQNSLFRTGAYIATGTTPANANPQADSSSAKDMLGANKCALLISYTLDDSVSTAILALEIRGHISQNTDSVSTFPWRGWGTHTLTGLAVKDTVGSMTDPQSVLQGMTILTDTTNVAPTERPIILNQINPEHRYLWVPLSNDRGEWFAAPYISVRARIIKTYGASGVALTGKASPKTTINIDLVGWR